MPGVEPGPSGWKPDILAVRPRGNNMFSPGIEPGTFCVLDRCDNRYTTKTGFPIPFQGGISTPPMYTQSVSRPCKLAQSDNVESKCQRYRGRCVSVEARFGETPIAIKIFEKPAVLNHFLSTSG